MRPNPEDATYVIEHTPGLLLNGKSPGGHPRELEAV